MFRQFLPDFQPIIKFIEFFGDILAPSPAPILQILNNDFSTKSFI